MAFEYLKGKTDKDMSSFIATLHEVHKVFIQDIVEAEVDDDKCPYFEVIMENEFGQITKDKTYHRDSSKTKSGKDEVYFSDFMKALTGCFQGDVFDTLMRLKRDKIPFWIFAGYDISENKKVKKGEMPYYEKAKINTVWTKEPKTEEIDELIKKSNTKSNREISKIMAKHNMNTGIANAMSSDCDDDDDDDDCPF